MFKQAGVGRVIVKLGGANNGVYVSSSWKPQADNARAAGLAVEHYWFNGRADTPEAQAAAIAAVLPAGERLWWDVEGEGSMPRWSPAEVVAHAAALERRGIPVSRQGVYLSSAETRADNWKPVVDRGLALWVADYGRNDGTVNSEPLVNYWPDVALWQYTSVGKLPGYTGNLDLNTSRPVWTVLKLQIALNKVLNAGLVEDGIDGSNTRAAVRAYQESEQIDVDGIAGRDTLTRLAADYGGIPESPK